MEELIDGRLRGSIFLSLKRSTSNSHRCCYPSCQVNVSLTRIPQVLQYQVLAKLNFFILDGTKACNIHLDSDAWKNVEQVASLSNFSTTVINRAVKILQNPKPKDFFSKIPRSLMEICKRNTGFEEEKFIDLLNSLSSLNAFIKSRETAPAALYMYLMKMHTGFPSEDIGNVFNITKASVQILISQIRSVLKIDLVPHYVNYVRSREDLIQHNTAMIKALFDSNNEQKVMMVADGSYIYIHKRQNYMHQKKTFSGQKKRNFIKVMNVVAWDGTIIYSIAPFPGTSNDASIFKNLFENTIMFDNLLPGDILLLDRGFRDVVKTIESKGIVVKMPSNVQSSERKGQLTTVEANRSRLVTALRFVVETRNGHLKTIWKKFDTIWCAYDQMHLAEDLEICSALINKYFPVFGSNRGIAGEVAERMMSKLDEVNKVGNVVTKQSFQKNYKKFIQFDHFNELPKMQENRLFWISLGAYQVKQAVSYTQMHLKQNNRTNAIHDEVKLTFSKYCCT